MNTTNLIKTDFRRHIAYIRMNKVNRNHLRNYGLFFSLFLIDTGFRGIILHRIVHSFCSGSRIMLYITYFFLLSLNFYRDFTKSTNWSGIIFSPSTVYCNWKCKNGRQLYYISWGNHWCKAPIS